MASVKIEDGKLKGPNATKAQFRHSAKDSRLSHEHSNPDIDKSKTGENTALVGLSYADICKLYDERIESLDNSTNRNKRKDRVTCACFVINQPDGIPPEKSDQWFQRANDCMKEVLGEGNFLECYIHRDEVHAYKDATTGEWRTSQIHGHSFWIPEHDGQLSCKWLSSREHLMAMNKAIDDMSVNEFGVRFLTGERSKSRGRTDDMKRRSASLELKEAKQMKEQAKACLKVAQDTASKAYALKRSLKGLEATSKAEWDSLRERAENALTGSSRPLEWHPDEASEKCLKRRKARFKNQDGTVTEKTWYDVLQEDLQKSANRAREKQVQMEQERIRQIEADRVAQSAKLDRELEKAFQDWDEAYAKSQEDMASLGLV